MSQSKTSLLKWPSNWLFCEDKYSSIGWELLKRQQFAKFILDLGTKLNLYVSHLFILLYLKTIFLDLIVVSIQLLFICKDF